MKYKPGIVHILNGYGAQLTWEPSMYIKEEAPQTIYTNLSIEEITSIIEGADPFGEPQVYLFIPQYDGKGIPKIALGDYLYPPGQHYYFILIDNTGLSEKKREAVEIEVKLQDNEIIKSCHLKGQNYLRRSEFKEWYNGHSKEDKEILNRFSKSPWMLKKLKEGEISLLDVISNDIENNKDYAPYVEKLGKRDSLKMWRTMPASLAYRFFINKEMNKAGGYLTLAGGIHHSRYSEPNREWLIDTPSLQEYQGDLKLANGVSSTLWYYLVFFKENLDPDHKIKHFYLLGLFALWVYISNTTLSSKKRDSFRKNGRFYNFYPNKESINLIEHIQPFIR